MGFLRSLSQRFRGNRRQNPLRQVGTSGYRQGFEPTDMERRKQCECKIMLLDGSNMNIVISKNATGQEIYQQVFYSLDIEEKDYFGLQFTDHYQVQHWLDPVKKLSKQVPIGPPYTFRFRVKFFISEPSNLHEELTRYQFFLQLKQDVQTGRLPCSKDTAVELAALALQSELGDYNSVDHTPLFVSEFRFHPEQDEDMEIAVLEKFITCRGLSPAAAELNYLNKAKWMELYGVDMHTVEGKDGNFYKLGLTPTGMLVFDGMQKIGLFYWEKIQKLEFKNKKLTLVVEEDADQASGQIQLHTFVFNLSSHKACKHLWKCAIEHHTFFRLRFLPPRPRKRSQFFRLGSTFRYRGRTEYENVHKEGGRLSRRQSATFERKPSQRYGPRLSLANRHVQLRSEIREQCISEMGTSLLPDVGLPATASSANSSMFSQGKPKAGEGRATASSDGSSLGVRHSPVGSSMPVQKESNVDKITAASVRLDKIIFNDQNIPRDNELLATNIQPLDESPSASRKAYFNDYKRPEEPVLMKSVGSSKLNDASLSNGTGLSNNTTPSDGDWLPSRNHITTIPVGVNSINDVRSALRPLNASSDTPLNMPPASSSDDAVIILPSTADANLSLHSKSVEKNFPNQESVALLPEGINDCNDLLAPNVHSDSHEVDETEESSCFVGAESKEYRNKKPDEKDCLPADEMSSTAAHETSLPSRIPHLISTTQSYEQKKFPHPELSKLTEKPQKSKLPMLSSSSMRTSIDLTANQQQERVSRSKIPKMSGTRPHQGSAYSQGIRPVQSTYSKSELQSTRSRITTDI